MWDVLILQKAYGTTIFRNSYCLPDRVGVTPLRVSARWVLVWWARGGSSEALAGVEGGPPRPARQASAAPFGALLQYSHQLHIHFHCITVSHTKGRKRGKKKIRSMCKPCRRWSLWRRTNNQTAQVSQLSESICLVWHNSNNPQKDRQPPITVGQHELCQRFGRSMATLLWLHVHTFARN